eukprot:TsM_000791201 transcript=TsM_000791201 gene=TsM_000791201
MKIAGRFLGIVFSRS